MKHCIVLLLFVLAGGMMTSLYGQTHQNIYVDQLYDNCQITIEPGIIYELVIASQCENSIINNVTFNTSDGSRLYMLKENTVSGSVTAWLTVNIYDEYAAEGTNYYSIVSAASTPGYYISRSGSAETALNYWNMNNDVLHSKIYVYSCTDGENIGEIYDVTISNLSAEGTVLSWNDNSTSTSWQIRYGMDPNHLDNIEVVNSRSFHFPLLEENSEYFYRIYNSNNPFSYEASCENPIRSFYVPCSTPLPHYVDYTALRACYNHCYHGFTSNPFATREVADEEFNPNEYYQHHRVIRTPGQDPVISALSMLPPDGSPSVRLGDRTHGGRGEVIEYLFQVDTTISDLLLFKYACVMQNPEHEIAIQPYVDFKFLDEEKEIIDPSCCNVRFYAGDASSGWNITPNGIYWKDWTTIGIDLTPLHGQNVTVQLRNSDCGMGGHFSYCYFAFENTTKLLKGDSCGHSQSITFTAPDGFIYRWYSAGDETTTLSNDPSYTIDDFGTYYCWLGYPHAPSCGVTLKAEAGDRYPFANFSYERLGMGDSCKIRYQFRDLSRVSSSPDVLADAWQRVDSVFWDFGDGTFSEERNPVHDFLPNSTPGVTAYAILAGGQCVDTITQIIDVGNSPCLAYDTIQALICGGRPYRFLDTVVYKAGEYDRDSMYHFYHLILQTDTIHHGSLVEEICSSALPWTNSQGTFYQECDSVVFHITRESGCDSILFYTLRVHDTFRQNVDSIICPEQFPLTWNGAIFDTPGSQQYVVYPTQYGCDSVVRMRVLQRQVGTGIDIRSMCNGNPCYYEGEYYTMAGEYTFHATTADGCDSLTILTLTENHFQAEIHVDPMVATYEHATIHLKDASNSVARVWELPDITSTLSEWDYLYPVDRDSVVCWLFAEDAQGCRDTDHVVIPLDRHSIWAPNVFTPEESANNHFKIYGDGIDNVEVTIFDRIGRIVACWKGIDGYWDGTYSGAVMNAHGSLPCMQQEYVYLVKYTYLSEPDNLNVKTGTVLLLK